jgi:hypothetical protein
MCAEHCHMKTMYSPERIFSLHNYFTTYNFIQIAITFASPMNIPLNEYNKQRVF